MPELDGVAVGGLTVLNAEAWRYATFFDRVGETLYGVWRVEFVPRPPPASVVVRPRGGLARVALAVTLDASGRAVEVSVRRSSGLSDVDALLAELVRSSAPFPNVPHGLLDDRRQYGDTWVLALVWGRQGRRTSEVGPARGPWRRGRASAIFPASMTRNVPPELLSENHPVLRWLLLAAAAIYAVAFVAALLRSAAARRILAAGVVVHLAAMTGRGIAIGFFPLTNKMESFSTCALATALVAVIAWRPARAYVLPLLAVGGAAMVTALAFPGHLAWPPPLMRTVWYPLHVPISFVAYGCWTAAATASLAWLADRDGAWLALVDRLALWGFALWSLSMIFGGHMGGRRLGRLLHVGSQGDLVGDPLVPLRHLRAPAAHAVDAAAAVGAPGARPRRVRLGLRRLRRDVLLLRAVEPCLQLTPRTTGSFDWLRSQGLGLALRLRDRAPARDRLGDPGGDARGGVGRRSGFDDLRGFFAPPSWVHWWFYALMALAVLYGLNTVLATWDTVARRWTAGVRAPGAYAASIIHVGFLVAMAGHALGGFTSEDHEPVIVTEGWGEVPGFGEARLLTLEVDSMPNGMPRSARATLAIRAPDGAVRQEVVDYNQPLSSGLGGHLALLSEMGQVNVPGVGPRPAILLRPRTTPSNPWALVSAVLVGLGVVLMWRRLVPRRSGASDARSLHLHPRPPAQHRLPRRADLVEPLAEGLRAARRGGRRGRPSPRRRSPSSRR